LPRSPTRNPQRSPSLRTPRSPICEERL
jgi:hypothetical protein